MNYFAGCTENGTTNYPMHYHASWEIMCYVNGSGYLSTSQNDYHFEPGTIIIMPPSISHSNSSEKEYKCISIRGSFNHLLHFTTPLIIKDNEEQDGVHFAKMIYRNRFDNTAYLSTLCIAYVLYLLKNKNVGSTPTCINHIISEIIKNASDATFNVTHTLNKSGYSEDYIRAQFKKYTGMTPTEFLSSVRLQNACQMIDVYGKELSITQIAENCGFVDSVYFSKRFKLYTGVSPSEYTKRKI